MNAILDTFAQMDPGRAAFWLLVENVLLFALALAIGEILVRAFPSRMVGPAPLPVEAREVGLAISCVALNTLVTIAGWWLWRSGYIVVRRDTGWRAWFDVVALLLMMDLAMYVTHRL